MYELDHIACSSTSACVVVGEATVNDGPGLVEATSNGGTTWATQNAPTSSLAFKGVVCPATDGCIAVGDGSDTSGAIVIGQAPITAVGIPANGTSVSGNSAVLDASASSPEGMSTVKFEVSGGSLSDQVVATASPTIYGWIGSWNTTAVPNGLYTLQSVATDDDGAAVTGRAHHRHGGQPGALHCGADSFQRGRQVGDGRGARRQRLLERHLGQVRDERRVAERPGRGHRHAHHLRLAGPVGHDERAQRDLQPPKRRRLRRRGERHQ